MSAQDFSGITLLGLGPGDPQLLTLQAWEVLNAASEIHLRTFQHPTVKGFPNTLEIFSFDSLYDSGGDFEAVYAQIVERILQLGNRPEGVIYAVPGHPYVAEATSPEIARRAREKQIPLRVVSGISFIEPVLSALETDPFPHMNLVDAFELSGLHHPPFPPDVPSLVAQIYSQMMASEVKLTLMAVYPDEHPVVLVHGAGTQEPKVERVDLYEIDRSPNIGLLTTLYLPPIEPQSSFESFQEILAHLRAPDGCPWDQEQTHKSLRPHLMEETFEVLAALDKENPESLQEELGDLLFQVVFHAQIAFEAGEFTMGDVIRGISTKLIRRHPHVFGALELEDVEGVILNWERLKAAERESENKGERSLLDGVPLNLPSLSQSQAYQSRASRIGFDWHEINGVFEKIGEELSEIRTASNDLERENELGDLLFVIVRLADWYNVDAESALRSANARFRQRFTHIESVTRERGVEISELSLEDMNVLWEEAKKTSD